MKDHEKRELVNKITKVAQEYGHTQQLRSRIAGVVLSEVDAILTAERELHQAAIDAAVAAELGAVLTYTTIGHSRPCGQIMGANGTGDFALLIYCKPNEAGTAARKYIRELEASGYRIKTATLVINEECYSGPQIRTLQAPTPSCAAVIPD